MPPPTNVTATFPTESQADTAINALTESGVDRNLISRKTAHRDTETRFLIRLVANIVLWSIAGGAIGAAMGVLLWLILGPDGTGGLIIQTVSWLIFGHIIAGLWAGYLLLADRTEADLPHERQTDTILTINCATQAAADRVEIIAAESGGRTTTSTGPPPTQNR